MPSPCLKCYEGINCEGCQTKIDGKKWEPTPITPFEFINILNINKYIGEIVRVINKHFGLEE